MNKILTDTEVTQVMREPQTALSLPARVYYDASVWEFERNVLFRKSWMAVGFGVNVPTPGSIYPLTFAGYELLLVRDLQGKVRCFHNLCRHRGMKLAEQAATDQKKITCSYHCWTYALDGRLIATPHISGKNVNEHDGLNKADFGLVELRTQMWLDLIFVNIDGNAPPLDLHFDQLTKRFPAGDLAVLKQGGDLFNWNRNANWKIVIESGIEDYHLPFIHEGFDYNNTYTDEDGGDAYQGFSSTWPMRALMARADPPSPESEAAASLDLPVLPSCEGKEEAETVLLYLLPTGMITTGPNMIRLTTINPISPEKTLQVHSFYYVGDAATSEDHAVTRKEILDFWIKIAAEDDHVIDTEQLMAKARHDAGLYGAFSPRWENNLLNFHKYVARQYEGHFLRNDRS